MSDDLPWWEIEEIQQLMSELTQCNFCRLQNIGARAAHQGKFVKKVRSKSTMGGWEIHVVDYGEEPTRDNWRAWLMSITNHCVC